MTYFWRFFNLINLLSIILVVVFSEDITAYLNEYRLYLIEQEELSDGGHALRWLLVHWEGLCMAGTIALMFFIRKVGGLLGGVYNKVTTTK